MTTLLLIGKVNPRVREKLTGRFDIMELPSASAEDITPDMAAKVAGTASFNAMPASIMDALPNIKIIANFGVGYDGVDVKHAVSKGIIVTNTPDVLDEE